MVSALDLSPDWLTADDGTRNATRVFFFTYPNCRTIPTFVAGISQTAGEVDVTFLVNEANRF
jgi:hypothetical protein